jgi:hypothetical protein
MENKKYETEGDRPIGVTTLSRVFKSLLNISMLMKCEEV